MVHQEPITHRFVEANGLKIHIAEQGSGPLVLLLHGFPDSWYSWRHQLPALAQAGFHAVAPDLRGYGDTIGPQSPDEYTIFHILGDLVALLEALGENEPVFVVGHDWGSNHAADLALLRPERVKALVQLSVPFEPRLATGSFLSKFRQLGWDGFYVCRFQEPGVAEAVFERKGYDKVLKAFFVALTDNVLDEDPAVEDFVNDPPQEFPSWFTPDDLAHYVETYKKSGFTTPINIYRAIERNWRLKAPWTGMGLAHTPVLTILGENDMYSKSPSKIHYLHSDQYKALIPHLEGVISVKDASHFVHQMQPEVVTGHILTFLKRHLS